MGRERYGPVERERTVGGAATESGMRRERGAKCVWRRDSRAGARHRGTQRHVVATGGVSRARAFGSTVRDMCECCVWCPINSFAKFDTRTHTSHTSHKQPRTLRAQQSAASLATSVSSEPPLPQQLSAIPTRPLPFLLCPFTLHIPHSCPFTPARTAATPLCVFLSRPTSNILPCPTLQCCMHCSPSSAFFPCYTAAIHLKREAYRRHHPVVR